MAYASGELFPRHITPPARSLAIGMMSFVGANAITQVTMAPRQT